MADNAITRRDLSARTLAFLAAIVAVVALIWAIRADNQAKTAINKANATSVQAAQTKKAVQTLQQTSPNTSTGTASGSVNGSQTSGTPSTALPNGSGQ